MSRSRVSKKKAARDFGFAVIIAVVCALILIDTFDSEASKPHAWISGVVDEWSLIGLRSPALRLRLKDEPVEFRVSLDLVREALHGEIPPGLVRGARVSVLVQPEEYAHPRTPLLYRKAPITFIQGLRINDKEVFGLAAARSWEEKDRAWGYVLLAAALAYAVYAGARWRRAKAS